MNGIHVITNANVPIEVARDIVGHAHKSMTRRYNRVYETTLKNAMKKVADGVVVSPSERAFGIALPTTPQVALDNETLKLLSQYTTNGEDVNDLIKRLLCAKMSA